MTAGTTTEAFDAVTGDALNTEDAGDRPAGTPSCTGGGRAAGPLGTVPLPSSLIRW